MPVPPIVGEIFQTKSGYMAVIVVDFLKQQNKVDAMGCQFGGYLLTPSKDTYCWWQPTGFDPRRPEASLTETWRAEYDPVYQPILEPHPGTPRAQATFFSRLDDVRREWGAKTRYANRLQRVGDSIISHVIEIA